jgi:hypothetical protein
MKAMQQLIKIPEVAATMRDLSKEMMKVIYSCWYNGTQDCIHVFYHKLKNVAV